MTTYKVNNCAKKRNNAQKSGVNKSISVAACLKGDGKPPVKKNNNSNKENKCGEKAK
jgi:hypothetical protein